MARGGLQLGSGIGTVMGPASTQPDDDDDRGSAREVLGPDTEHGQALLLAGIGIVLLALTIARGERGVVAKLGRVMETVVMVAAAMWVANYAARTYVALNPDGPLAAGIRWDS